MTYTTAFHTPFTMFNKDVQEEMSRLYSQIFAVLVTEGRPYMTSIIWMNDNFQELYMNASTGEEVYTKIFEHFNITINTTKGPK